MIHQLKWFKTYYKRIDYIRTLYINFKMLPLKQAIHFPIILGHGVRFKKMSGNIILNVKHLSPGIITFAIYNTVVDHNSYIGFFDIAGTIIFKGKVKFHTGAKVVTKKNAILTFEGENTLGHLSVICCAKKISFGYFVTISWNCQIYDTNFHFFEDTESKTIKPRSSYVILGDYVFCGNGSNICKNSIIPKGCVISNFSIINKDFTSEGEFLLIAGNPATVIKKGYRCIYGKSLLDNSIENFYAKSLE